MKLGKQVAAATIGDYLVNPNLYKISSLSNRLFDNKNNMLNSSRCLDFSNGKCMSLGKWKPIFQSQDNSFEARNMSFIFYLCLWVATSLDTIGL